MKIQRNSFYKKVLLISVLIIFKSCNYNKIFLNYNINKPEIQLEFIGNSFFIDNFSNKPNYIKIKCSNKFDDKIIKNLPLLAYWTHQSKQERIVSNNDGIATFQLCSLWTNKKNQVLRVSIETDYFLFDNNDIQVDSTLNYIETNVKTRSPKIFLETSIKNLGKPVDSTELISVIKKYFKNEFFTEFKASKLESDFILNCNVETFEKTKRSNPDFPFIIHTKGILSLSSKIEKKNIFKIKLPELKAGDYDRIHAGKKVIKDLSNYIKNNDLL
ncbi:MAG: hypothetical protein ACJZ14_04005 [Candidatus Neomarinimicrobiota bacterium]